MLLLFQARGDIPFAWSFYTAAPFSSRLRKSSMRYFFRKQKNAHDLRISSCETVGTFLEDKADAHRFERNALQPWNYLLIINARKSYDNP